MNDLIDDFQELSCEKDHLFYDFIDQKFEYLNIKNCMNVCDEENYLLKKQVEQLNSLVLNLKFEIVKMSMSEKGKGVISEAHKRMNLILKSAKLFFLCEKEKVSKLNLEVSRLKINLKRASK